MSLDSALYSTVKIRVRQTEVENETKEAEIPEEFLDFVR